MTLSKDLVYRALMPTHYLPRLNAHDDAQRSDLDGSRKWISTRLPYLRVFAPLWSFGLVVDDLKDAATVPDSAGADRSRLFGIRALEQASSPAENSPLGAVHQPRLFLARIESFLQVGKTLFPQDRSRVVSRLSTLALRTITSKQLTNEVPVWFGDQPVMPNGDAAQPTVVLAPFGDPFERPDRSSRNNLLPDRGQFLPAMRLVHGLIRLEPPVGYLAKARKILALHEPVVQHAGNKQLILLPDGFALRAGTSVPWRDGPVDGWVQVTVRSSAEVSQVEPILRPWFDPEDPDPSSQQAEWRKALSDLAALLDAARRHPSGPTWMDLRLSDRTRPEDLTWPLEFAKTTGETPRPTILVQARSGPACLEIAGGSLVARLADRRQIDRPTATLTIEPERFRLCLKEDGTLALSADVTGSEHVSGGATAVYRFEATNAFSERIDFEPQSSSEPADQTLILAVPMLDTAARLRSHLGLPPPRPGQTDAQVWTFTPIREGWLHWPLPNPTPTTLAALLNDESAVATSKSPNDPGDGISGALVFAAVDGEPDWTLSLAEPVRAELSAVVSREEKAFRSFNLTLYGPTVALDGAVRVVPFRQTNERLVPSSADRALRGLGLLALSPTSLVGDEARAWALTDQSARAPRVSLSLRALRVERINNVNRTSSDALDLEVRLPEGQVAAPWIWARHSTLPTIQSLPLAVAGGAISHPDDARSLAPLVTTKAGRFHRYQFSELGLGRSEMALSRAEGTVGEGPFQRPDSGDSALAAEIGMAVTTLPSVTLFPGMPGMPGMVEAPGLKMDINTWAGFTVLGGVRAHFRHDLAICDEINALAVAPPPDQAPPDVEDALPAGLFEPRSDNGPGFDAQTNVYDRVWRDLGRRAALAALDRRDLVLEGVGTSPHALSNLLGTSRLPGVATLTTTVSSPDGRRVDPIGAWTFEPTNGAKLSFAGLPSEGDLSGFVGSFPRPLSFPRALGNAELIFGTARLDASNGVFVDQDAQTHSHPVSVWEGCAVLRSVRQNDPKREVRLLSLVAPLPVRDHGDLSFWVCDCPIDDSAPFLERYAACDNPGHTTRMDGAGLADNPLAGFRWSLSDTNRPDGLVVVHGFVFEPLALTSLTADEVGAFQAAVIRGNLRLPVGDASTPTLPMSEGGADLHLRWKSKTLSAELQANSLVFPLTNPQTDGGASVMLELDKLPNPGGSTGGTLHYRLGDRPYTLKVAKVTRRAATAAPEEPLLSTEVRMDSDEKGGIAATKLLLHVRAARRNSGGSITLTLGGELGELGERGHTAEMTLQIAAAPLKATATDTLVFGTIRYNILAPLAKPTVESLTLKAFGEVIPLTTERSGMAMADNQFAMVQAVGEREPPILDALRVSSGRVSLLASLSEDNGESTSPRFQMAGLEMKIALHLTGPAGALRLVLDRATPDAAPEWRLYGKMSLQNALSWPRVTIQQPHGDDAGATNTSGAVHAFEVFDVGPNLAETVQIRHKAKIVFDGATPAFDSDKAIICPAMVSHTLAVEGESDLHWGTFQTVRLMTAAQLRVALNDAAVPSTPTVVGLSASPTGFSPVGGTAAAPLSDYAAAPHWLHLAASGPAGFSGPLADQVARTITENARFLAVDYSAHSLLFVGSESDPLAASPILVSLPAIGFLAPAGQSLPWHNDDSIQRELQTRPLQQVTFAQPLADGIRARHLPPFDAGARAALFARVGEVLSRPGADSASVAQELLGVATSGRTRPVFQPVVLERTVESSGTTVWRAAWNWPGAGTAMHLSAVLDAMAKRPGSVLAVSLRAAPYLTSRDLALETELRHPTRIDQDAYRRALGVLHQKLLADLVPGPGLIAQEPPVDSIAYGVLRLFARSRDGSTPRLVAERVLDTDINAGDLDVWGRTALLRLAPWARLGLLQIGTQAQQGISSTPALDETIIIGPMAVPPPASRPRALVRARLPARQRQFEPLVRPDLASADPSGRFALGYRAQGLRPLELATAAEDMEESEDRGDRRLRTTAVAVDVVLVGRDGALLTSKPPVDANVDANVEARLWLSDRQRVAFRPSSTPSSFMLPSGYDAELPATLLPVHPANRDAPERRLPYTDCTRQRFAPAILSTTTISGRPGAFATWRAGLSLEWRDSSHGLVRGEASQAVVNGRLPRPVPFGRDDRVRAGEFDPRPLLTSEDPSAYLYGPGPTAPSAVDAGPGRRLRAASAQLVTLRRPDRGLIPPGWSGTCEVLMDSVIGEDAKWSLISAALTVRGQRFGMDPRSEAKGTLSISGVSAAQALASYPPGTDVQLDLVFKHAEGVTRQIVFDLLTGGRGIAVPKGERPLFLSFEDPDYNEQLEGQAHAAREPLATMPNTQAILAAETGSVRPHQVLELALGLRPLKSGVKQGGWFNGREASEDPKAPRVLELKESNPPRRFDVRLTLQRQRPGEATAQTLSISPEFRAGTGLIGTDKDWFLLEFARQDICSLRLPCHALGTAGGAAGAAGAEAGLRHGDHLLINISAGDTEPLELNISLRLLVTSRPDLPANGCAYAVLMLREGAVSVPMFATGPEPTQIELVDPNDLIDGVVRRRASYRWRTFFVPDQGAQSITVQKIQASGASWLSADLDGGWVSLE